VLRVFDCLWEGVGVNVKVFEGGLIACTSQFPKDVKIREFPDYGEKIELKLIVIRHTEAFSKRF